MIGNAHQAIEWLRNEIACGRGDAAYEVKPKRERRSLTQNAYYWVMLNQLASTLGYPESEVHQLMLREYGVHDVFSVQVDVPIESYFKYFDVIGSGTVNGKMFKHIRAHKRSSEMDSGEFSHLIDGLRQECESQGIQVKTPEEIARLQWVDGTGKKAT